jgi:hypothetical protein
MCTKYWSRNLNRPSRRPEREWYNIETYVTEAGHGDVNWNHLADDWVECRDLLKMVAKLQVSYVAKNY